LLLSKAFIGNTKDDLFCILYNNNGKELLGMRASFIAVKDLGPI
jgi:hypothetical protein